MNVAARRNGLKINTLDVQQNITIGKRSWQESTQPTCEVKVFQLDGDTLGVDGGEIGVLEEGDKVGLCGFLERHDGGGWKAQVGLDKE
jgi:hypothetical protein